MKYPGREDEAKVKVKDEAKVKVKAKVKLKVASRASATGNSSG